MSRSIPEHSESQVKIAVGNASIVGSLIIPNSPKGIVLFAHGSGSSRFSPRNRYVAKIINQAGIATLLFDLLTREEEEIDTETGEFRFDIPLLSRRLIKATRWLKKEASTKKLQIGYFGSSTGAAAALIAAAELPDDIATVVSRGGRPDLAMQYLPKVKAPVLLIVGGEDRAVIEINREAMKRISAATRLEIVPGASHLFEEPGKLEKVADLATDWFQKHFAEATNT